MTENTQTTPDDSHNSKKKTIKQLADATKPLDVVGEAQLIDYDVDMLEKFVSTVFHSELAEDEYILGWSARSSLKGGLPTDIDDMLPRFRRTKHPKGLYFATSTVSPSPDDGKLYNRGALFKRFHVLVLDDIGTKVPMDKLPKEFAPTYKIETSPGNFHYGYVLEQPLEDLELSKALVQMVYTAGFSDTGGKMPTKIVRLPDGHNGKPGRNRDFRVKLHDMDGPRWTPERIMDVLDLGVTWEAIKKDTSLAAERQGLNRRGTAAWQPAAKNTTLSGVSDPVLDWLYENNMVKQEVDQWVTVECPWHDLHSNEDNTAGYSPLGRGDDKYVNHRGFKCFHDHCSQRTGHDFLSWVAEEGGPECAVSDVSGDLVARYAYDPINDQAWEIRDTITPHPIPLKGFNNMYGNAVRYVDREGKVKTTTAAKQWMTSPYQVLVHGQTFDPMNPERLVSIGPSHLAVNTFKQPAWGDGPLDEGDLAQWLEFIEYLIPNEFEREYFLDWLACKAQNMGFRGAAILMVAQKQGTGRTTLADMLGMLFGSSNCARVSFPTLCKGNDTGFNEWAEKPLVFTDETLSLAGENYYKVYEGLKEMFDPRPKEMEINPKYGKKRVSQCHTSFLMFSNHADALATAATDRRIFVLNNADTPWPGEKFGELNDWINERDDDGQPFWALTVWRWLQQRNVDPVEMTKPAPSTQGKRTMLLASKSAADIIVETVIAETPETALLAPQMVKTVCMRLAHRMDYDPNKHGKLINRLVRDHTCMPHDSLVLKWEGKTVRPKVKAGNMAAQERFASDIGKVQRGHQAAILAEIDIDRLVEKCDEALDLADL
jgi:hypothetical protein